MSDKDNKDKNKHTDDDTTETFSVIDFVDYKRRKETESLEEEFHEEEFDLNMYLSQLREEEKIRQQNLRVKRIKDLAILFYCWALTITLVFMLVNC